MCGYLFPLQLFRLDPERSFIVSDKDLAVDSVDFNIRIWFCAVCTGPRPTEGGVCRNSARNEFRLVWIGFASGAKTAVAVAYCIGTNFEEDTGEISGALSRCVGMLVDLTMDSVASECDWER
jgi:hypothetical protein